jgi:hypothetical protein
MRRLVLEDGLEVFCRVSAESAQIYSAADEEMLALQEQLAGVTSNYDEDAALHDEPPAEQL